MHVFKRILLILLMLPGAILAQTTALPDDEELDARLRYLDSAFKDLKDPYQYWQYGWTGVYAVSAAAQAYKAADEDDSDESTKQWVGAAKSAGGLALMMLKPVPMVAGMDQYQAMPSQSRADKLARLAEAEKMLEHTAWRSDDRYTWKPHAMTVGVNILGAIAIASFGDSDDALGSALLGIAIGEAAIWSQPTAAESKWQGYQQKFNGAEQSAFQWQIVPKLNGVELQVRF